MTWKNWPFLVGGALLVVGLLFLAHSLKKNQVISSYLADISGALTAVILSIATYDEYERRRQRKRYLPPEKMGVSRIQEEVYQLMFQYAFMMNLRYNPSPPARQAIEKTSGSKKFTKPETELHAKAAKHISQEEPEIKRHLFENSKQALQKPELRKLTYSDINQLILQTERTIQQIDVAIATYGYSMTPEVHKWAVDVRELLSQTITGKHTILSVRLSNASSQAEAKLNAQDREGLNQVIDELIKVGRKAKNVKVQ